jgi:hypothetical protein
MLGKFAARRPRKRVKRQRQTVEGLMRDEINIGPATLSYTF